MNNKSNLQVDELQLKSRNYYGVYYGLRLNPDWITEDHTEKDHFDDYLYFYFVDIFVWIMHCVHMDE